MDVQLGCRTVQFPGEFLGELECCNHLLHDVHSLRSKIEDKGYLFIRDFHSRSDVFDARNKILHHINCKGANILDTASYNVDDGVLNHRCGLGCVPFMEGRNDITHCSEMRRIIEGSHAFNFFDTFFGEKSMTFDFKWLRGMHTGGYTGAHVDRVYMSRGSQELLTMWTPLDDIHVGMGVLAVCEGSHRRDDKRFTRLQETYAECDLEEKKVSGSGWFSEDPAEIGSSSGMWKTADFRAGDVIIFNMRLVHMSTANLTRRLRLSCDTRWQPESHAVDSRFVGQSFNFDAPKFGVHADANGGDDDDDATRREDRTPPLKPVTIESMKREWGFL